MSNVRKRIEELNLIEDFLFTEASCDKKTSEILMRLIIERATNLKVGRLVIEPQKTINGIDTTSHGIRMDVSIQEVTDANGSTIRLFDVEPNSIQKVHLPKRSRFYQALTDVKLLETGVDYDKLPDMWTIWILPYDPFGMDFMLYSVKNIVEENPEIDYNDGVRKLFLYTRGKKGGTKALRNLLTYLENSLEENAVDEELKRLHTNVERLKCSKEVGVKYMQMQEVIKYKVEEEVEEILAQKIPEIEMKLREKITSDVTLNVEQRIAKLTQLLIDDNRLDDIKRVADDAEFRKELLEHYGLI